MRLYSMFAITFQLAGTILLSLMISLRDDNEHYKLVAVIMPIQGKVPYKLKDIYKETWMFRVGLFIIIIGYILQLLDIELSFFAEMHHIVRTVLIIFVAISLAFIGYAIAIIISKWKFSNAKPYDYDKSPEEGQIKIEI